MGWDQFQDDENEYRKRRDALGPDQPAVLTFDKRDVAALGKSLRDTMKEAIRHCAGLGAGDVPAGRRGAYAQVVFPLGGQGTSGEKLKAFGACPDASSCGTFIRGMWQLFGIGAPFEKPVGSKTLTPDRGLRCAYQDGEVFKQLAGFAFDCDALHGDATNVKSGTVALSDIDAWLPGDVVFIHGPSAGDNHIFTIFEKPAPPRDFAGLKLYDVKTVDGGQGPTFGDPDGNKDAGPSGDGNCRAIKSTTKQFLVGNGKIVSNNGTSTGGWQVAWWIDFSKLKVNEPSIWVPQVQQKLPGVRFPP